MATTAEIDLLDRLARTCLAGARCYRDAADQAARDSLVHLLERRASELSAAASELRALAGHGADALASTDEAGVPRAAGSTPASGDAARLDACERAEDAAMSIYLAALDQPLDPALRAVVERQYDTIKHAHGEIRALREQVREHLP